MKVSKSLALVVGLIFTPIALAATPTYTKEEVLKQKLTEVIGVDVVSMSKAPIDGLYQAITDRGVLYITEDGSKLFHGNIYDMENQMKNLTEASLAGPRLAMLKPFEDKMLVYKAKDEKYVVTVFTDVDCAYCRKLHSQMQEYNDLGITIRYLAYPRRGIPSANADEMKAVWCSKDPLKAMTDAKEGEQIKPADCDIDIAAQYKLGQTFGISGTPAIVLANGTIVPGYQPPQQLLKTIERNL
ncbi:bifunctional protein-disulfide isomerase/oxidoreductase DsbC [Shewanella intestini]|uniref:Thiol:disulfide interchange protein n=1 Tax=Shewanella intestini TaxID=2017544 RepID=A0ABS5I5Y2_9GAMM|nr:MULTISPECIES: bifunctional protein-disulfide isomerase/oxidoreductase DsbC [Shewanella]MBR9729422.1 bifunctional protein-disulfide isomerase/oxidoreductase DsbC [Shewanella intestini]MRG37502.1 bifunctional protein-disulfide isomerase/oxidoreductase DsbC [Shewanella sp. XMDDZSB0408]